MPDHLEQSTYENSEELNEIVSAIPPWILRWGIMIVFLILLIIVLLSSLIHYPDIIKAPVKIYSLNGPREIIANQEGKLIRLLVRENQDVVKGQSLAYLESTGNHADVIKLKTDLLALIQQLSGKNPNLKNNTILRQSLVLGELQNKYQLFYQDYLQYLNTLNNGFLTQQKQFIQKDIQQIQRVQQQILRQQKIQQEEYANALEEYEAYKKLRNKSVISNNEFKQQENKYLSSKYPLERSATELINNNTNYLNKQKEMAALDHTIKEQQYSFLQALNSMLNDTDHWILDYVISASLAGKVNFVGMLQENQNVKSNQALFMISPPSSNFFAEIQIPQYNMGKVAVGQKVLIKLRSYPFEEYGAVDGKISYMSDVAFSDSIFLAKADIIKIPKLIGTQPIVLKQGMAAGAEIVTRESSLLERFLRGFANLKR